MKLRPLTGNVLVELDAPARVTESGLLIGQHTVSAEENQQAAKEPKMPPGEIGVVKAIGPWPKTKSGLLRMPEFGVGARVLLPHGAGIAMRAYNDNFRMVEAREVLAVLV